MATLGEVEEQRGVSESLVVDRFVSMRSGMEHGLENEKRQRRGGGADLYGGVEIEGGGGDHKDIAAG